MYMATHENRCSTMLGNVTFIKARAPLYITGYGYTNSVILFPPCQKAYIPAYFVHTELHTAGALIKSFLSENAFAKVVLLLDTVRASGVTGGPMNPSVATSYLLA